MPKIDILIGSTLGNSEYVADEISAVLAEKGHETQLHTEVSLEDLAQSSLWIIVCSTHGAGDLPENIQPFLKEIVDKKPDLNGVRFALCAIGDSNYDTFCQGPEKLISALEVHGAIAYVDKIQIDVQRDPIAEEPAVSWLHSWIDQI